MYQDNSIWNDIRNEFKSGNALSQLIIINIAVFLGILIVKISINFATPDDKIADHNYYTFLSFLASTSDIKVLLTKPWTIISYMFVHEGFLHILFNMLWLYWLGKIIKEHLGDKVILPLYIMGGILGFAFYLIAYNLFPRLQEDVSLILGASAGVTAIVFATAIYLPNHTIYMLFLGAVRLKYIALAFIVLDLIAMSNLSNTGGHIAHIGGAAYGLLFISQLKKGNNWADGFYRFLYGIVNIFKANSEERKRTGGGKKERKNRKKGGGADDAYQKKIDTILDKISQSGYDSLTKEEKEFLFKASKKE